jgi:two-component system, NarL family, sensor kinase
MRWSRVTAIGLGIYCVGSFVVHVVMVAAGRVPGPDGGWPAEVAVLLAVPVAVTLVLHLRRHRVTRVLAIYVAASLTGGGVGSILALWEQNGALSAAAVSRLGNFAWMFTLPLLPLLIAAFSESAASDSGDGRLTGRWRHLWRAQLTAVGLLALLALADATDDGFEPVTAVLAPACGVVLIVTGTLAASRLVGRLVRYPESRRPLSAFAVLACLFAAAYVVLVPLRLVAPSVPDVGGGTVGYAVLVGGLPAAIGYGLLRHRLFGIDLVVARVLVIAVATMLVAGVYLAGVYLAALSFGLPRSTGPAVLLPAALLALAVVPAHQRLQRLVARAVYGRRGEPFAVLDSIAEQLVATPPDQSPARLVDLLRTVLRLPWVGLAVERDARFVRVAESGDATPGRAAEAFDLAYAGEVIGRLEVEPRRGEQTLGRLDRRLLARAATQVGPSVAAARLVDDLTTSRERLVTGREHERAHIRRELHDGLSPALAGISLALGAAKRLLPGDPAAAAHLLETASAEAASSSQDVRRLLEEMRPAGLAELGLASALEQRAQALSRPGEFEVVVAAEPLPPLSAALETAAYRIAVEAMSNAARHAQAHRCHVAMSANRALQLEIVDDGIGFTAPVQAGVGIESMRERAHDLGGRVTIQSHNGRGTRVVAELPLAVLP